MISSFYIEYLDIEYKTIGMDWGQDEVNIALF